MITNRIIRIGKINSKLTTLINEKKQNTIQDQVIFRKPTNSINTGLNVF
jgi:hypothetical protein